MHMARLGFVTPPHTGRIGSLGVVLVRLIPQEGSSNDRWHQSAISEATQPGHRARAQRSSCIVSTIGATGVAASSLPFQGAGHLLSAPTARGTAPGNRM